MAVSEGTGVADKADFTSSCPGGRNRRRVTVGILLEDLRNIILLLCQEFTIHLGVLVERLIRWRVGYTEQTALGEGIGFFIEAVLDLVSRSDDSTFQIFLGRISSSADCSPSLFKEGILDVVSPSSSAVSASNMDCSESESESCMTITLPAQEQTLAIHFAFHGTSRHRLALYIHRDTMFRNAYTDFRPHQPWGLFTKSNNLLQLSAFTGIKSQPAILTWLATLHPFNVLVLVLLMFLKTSWDQRMSPASWRATSRCLASIVLATAL